MKKQVFVQSEMLEKIEVIELSDKSGPIELRKACLALLPSAINVDDFNFYLEDNDDDEAFNRLNEIPDGLCVHLHRLKCIDVQVRYAGSDVKRTFRPSSTVGRVKRWSSQELNIPQSDAAELMLQICGTDVRPDADIHIGKLVTSSDRKICFDLVPSPRINGCGV